MSYMSNLDIVLQNGGGDNRTTFSMRIDGVEKKCSIVATQDQSSALRVGLIDVYEWNVCDDGSYRPTTQHTIPMHFASDGVHGKIKTGGHTYER
tara:strand:- start:345 stop:626 length:282 start_codon:yes stop_codon:yes gene_type:complete